MDIVKPVVLDLLPNQEGPALSSTNDLPVVDTKPDAQNEGAPPAAPVKEEPKEESATSPEGPSEDDKPKEAKGVQKRLNELVRQREEERSEKLRLMALLEKMTTQEPKPLEGTEPVPPEVLDYQDPEAFKKAMIGYTADYSKWAADKAVKAAQAESEEKSQREALEREQKTLSDQYELKLSKVKEKYPDFDEVGRNPDVKVPWLVAEGIRNSDSAGELQYYCGKHPEEAQKLFDLTPAQMLMELGKLEMKLTSPSVAAPTVSAAPKPIKPISAGTESSNKSDEEMSMDEYAAKVRTRENWADPSKPKTRQVRH